MSWRAITISGEAEIPLAGLGWTSLGVLVLTAMPSIDAEAWVPAVQERCALLVWGGDVLYLCHWMRQSDWQSCCHRRGASRSTRG